MVTRKTAELAFACMTALFGAVIAIGATEFGVGWSPSGPEPGTFPFYIGLIVAGASIGNAVFALLRQGQDVPLLERRHLADIARFVGPMVGFVLLTLGLGLYVATALYMFATMVVQGRYRVLKAAVVSLGLPLALYVLMEKAFQVPLLKGPLEAMIGL